MLIYKAPSCASAQNSRQRGTDSSSPWRAADLRIEAKEEDGTSNIDYDEENKVVRIPLSALGPEGQRRTKLVLFTCNKCGGRTARLVNPIAWDKGAVFGQCAKCAAPGKDRSHGTRLYALRVARVRLGLPDP
ncbi:hypothetical protein VOLCADRAFT_91932 [Volvox carteri f. nagariensis]|uniref:DNL-type domain-containing protein n=1 Tax=Volvox carteri f. nagariensis TaxID=3068 RepID=D8TYC1_VOLCA|nr:uncharacterized protein VOLCADRAFT_91932 [Volvox carteri f. nagariensis]EFJ47616.1 hypothetical protein VOLCADRAFT_91932 [Volvox carteri f. nagariensis]|eukprot:XP_002951440.1 hypothetical protein VOLCADRAFT_91932 [Volvox carteri f. nagariensis]